MSICIGYLLSLILLLAQHTAPANPQDYLEECRAKQVLALEGKTLRLTYRDTDNRLYHSFEPWQTYSVKSSGIAYIGNGRFGKLDSIVSAKSTLVAKLEWTSQELLYLGHGDTAIEGVTHSDHFDVLLESARISPLPLIEYFHAHASDVVADTSGAFAVYTLRIDKTVVSLSIYKGDRLVRKITQLSHHPTYGDVVSTFTYGAFSSIRNLFFPRSIKIEEIGDKVKEEVFVTSSSLTSDVTQLLKRPDTYTWKQEPLEKPKITEKKFSKHIHFIDLEHTDSKAMVVEFKDFLLVAEAPLSSENGEMIITKARKIAPGKPIRYFTFSHHHPHYLGGIRPFVHDGATILSIPEDTSYINFIVQARRTLHPDSLENAPQPLHLLTFQDSTTITTAHIK